MDTDDLVKGLVAGYLLDQLDARSKVPLYIGAGISVLGFFVVVVAGGWVRGFGLAVVLVGLIVMLAVKLARATARSGIRKFAEPHAVAERRAEIDAALAEAALPSGPLSTIRYLARFRKGVGSELGRLRSIFDELQADLGVEFIPQGDRSPELEGP